MSDTPRTDAAVHPTKLLRRADGTFVEAVDAITCRQLERDLAEAVAKERERCARVCEEFYTVENIAQKCAEAIRKGE